MISAVKLRIYEAPPFNEGEILRYAGCRRNGDAETVSLMRSVIAEASASLSYKVCYTKLPVVISDAECDFGAFRLESADLAKNLEGCGSAVVFAATVGFGIDRLITKYSRLSPARALMLQALGAERIEALCDTFCGELEKEYGHLRPRFSPGYGDVPLSAQDHIFALLEPSKKIGLCLNDSLLMSPTKSVTAFVGIE